MKIVTILGARPQFIKAGSVSRAIKKYNQKTNNNVITEVIIHTGQHFDKNMSDIFFDEMRIPKPHYNLNIHGLSHGAMTGQMLEKIEEVLLKEKPDWVLVYGDTNSTLAGALAASKLHIKVAHVEAGLRSFNMQMPEEVNRILTDRISNILFCPTDSAVNNLKKEGFPFKSTTNDLQQIIKSGDVMYDGSLFYSQMANKPDIKLPEQYNLCTVHRAENTDDARRLKAIIRALQTIAKEKDVILPLHPRTASNIQKYSIDTTGITIIEPVGYLHMVYLIKHADKILTDSGGLQKEAYFFQKPCITLRDETEWTELTKHHFNVLAGADKEKIVDYYYNFNFNDDYTMYLYGNGGASDKVIDGITGKIKQ